MLRSNHNFYLDFNANGTWNGASVDKNDMIKKKKKTVIYKYNFF